MSQNSTDENWFCFLKYVTQTYINLGFNKKACKMLYSCNTVPEIISKIFRNLLGDCFRDAIKCQSPRMNIDAKRLLKV